MDTLATYGVGGDAVEWDADTMGAWDGAQSQKDCVNVSRTLLRTGASRCAPPAIINPR